VTDRAAVIDTVHVVAVPEHEPPQPVNFEPEAGLAVSVTEVPWAMFAEHDEVQLMLPTLLVTEPDPVPALVTVSLHVSCAKLAVTDRAVVIDTVHVVAVPEHEPAHPVNTEPAAGLAVSVTEVPCAMLAVQGVELVQLMPPTLDVTVPAPVPEPSALAERVHALGENPAVTDLAAVIDNVQVVAVPEHDPPHPVKVDPVAGVAVSVTDVPLSRLAEHDEPQSMPPTLDVTVPEPDPTFATDSARVAGTNVAVVDLAVVIDNVHVADAPEQEPAHPVNTEPAPGVAVSVTDVPCVMLAEHDEPQSIPPTLEVTVPDPDPARAAVSAHALGENPAVTDLAAVIDTVQEVAIPVHEPPHPVNTEPSPGAAVSVTDVP
jgi:hypothetical protein